MLKLKADIMPHYLMRFFYAKCKNDDITEFKW